MSKLRNTDAEETQFVSASEIAAKRSTDSLDTQELDRSAIRTQAGYQDRNPYRRTKQQLHGTPMSKEQEEASYGNAPQQQPPYHPNNTGYYGKAPQQQSPYNTPNNTGYYGKAPQQQPSYPPNNTGYYGNAPQQQPPYHPNNTGYYGNAPQQQAPPPPRPRPQQPRSQQQSIPPQQQAAPKSRSQSIHPTPNTAGTSSRTKRERRPRNTKQRAGGGFLGKCIRIVLWIVILVFVFYSLFALVGILRMQRETAEDRAEISSDLMEAAYVDNVLLIGTDSRDLSEERGRSDSMILVSINRKTKEITMTSFLRDAYVYINDTYGNGKLNAAYSYGGASLLMDTIEANYGIQIDHYVLITFAACVKVIDAVGGVTLELSNDEAEAVNEILISEVNELMGDDRNDDLLEGGGELKLDGKQALSYSRIRYVGNADFERTSRQRTVMTKVLKKATVNPIALANICFSALPELVTNLSIGKAYGYAMRAPILLLGYELKQLQIPADNTFYSDTIDGESVLILSDPEENQEILKEQLFGTS